MTGYVVALLASYQPAWLAYQYGDRDPQVCKQAKLYETWLTATRR